MNIIQHIFIRDAKTVNSGIPLEVSVLAGENTFVLKRKLSKNSLDRIHELYRGLGIVKPSWKKFHALLEPFKFEPITEEIPNPAPEDRTILKPLVLESGEAVYLCVREVAVDAESLILAH